jgi:hypothetical protein
VPTNWRQDQASVSRSFETSELYGGAIALSGSERGGLRAQLELPAG